MRERDTIEARGAGARRGPRPTRGAPAALLLLAISWNMGPRAAASAIQIMPLGDSITQGYSSGLPAPGGYRAPLYRKLIDAGYDVEFVGSQATNPDPTLPAAAQSHEGHIGYLIAGTGSLAGSSVADHIDRWLAPGNGVDPDLVLLELGTNEILGKYHVAAAPYELAALVKRITELRPNAEVLVSTLTPTAFAASDTQIQAFNRALGGPDGIVAQIQKLGEDVTLVNAGGSLSRSDLNPYGIHPSREGYEKLATAWFDAIREAAPPARPPGPTPEPSTLAVLGFGLLGLLAASRTRARASASSRA